MYAVAAVAEIPAKVSQFTAAQLISRQRLIEQLLDVQLTLGISPPGICAS